MQSAIDYMENIEYELPYDGVKEMLLVDKLGNKEYLIAYLKQGQCRINSLKIFRHQSFCFNLR